LYLGINNDIEKEEEIESLEEIEPINNTEKESGHRCGDIHNNIVIDNWAIFEKENKIFIFVQTLDIDIYIVVHEFNTNMECPLSKKYKKFKGKNIKETEKRTIVIITIMEVKCCDDGKYIQYKKYQMKKNSYILFFINIIFKNS